MKVYLALLKLYLAVSGAVFLLVALFHLFRLLNQWPITVDAWTVPEFLSYIGLPVSTGYAFWAFWLFRRSSKANLSRLARGLIATLEEA